jgi:hypothetical protein
MLSLAPLRYRDVMARPDGPIDRIESYPLTVLGRRHYQANAFLRPGLRIGVRVPAVYGSADGSGTHRSVVIARHMAISEALERWAFRVASRGPDRARYGFDLDPSSNGMAAFPGSGRDSARRHARHEAIERYCLIAWWQGLLPAVPRATAWPGVAAVEIMQQFGGSSVAIVYQEVEEDLYVYGHAAAEDFEGACRRAAVEMARNELVMRRYRTMDSGRPPIDAQIADLFERRSVHFSYREGFAKFRSKVGLPGADWTCPELVFDGEIVGPWSEYTTVWRTLYLPPSREYLDRESLCFFW